MSSAEINYAEDVCFVREGGKLECCNHAAPEER